MIERVSYEVGKAVGVVFFGCREGFRWLGRQIGRLGL